MRTSYDKLPWQGAIEFNELSSKATTSLVIDKKNGWLEYPLITTFLDHYLEVYSKALHIAWSELSRNKSIKDVKRRLCSELNIKSRVADSAINEAKTILSAQRELLKTKKKDLAYELKNRINIKIQNIDKGLKNKKYKICFGSRRLLSYRHKIQNEATKYNTYDEWKEEWDSSRQKHIFTIGTTGDTFRNQLLKLIPNEDGWYSLKIADYKNGVERGTYRI